jgi:hypothetical protein
MSSTSPFYFFIIVKRRKCHCLLLPQFTFSAAKSGHATQQLACCHTAASCSSPKHADATTQLLPQLALPSRHLSPCFMAASTEPPVLASSELSLALGSPQVGAPSPPPTPRTNPVQFPGPTCSSSELSLALGSPQVGAPSPPTPRTNPVQFPGPTCSNLNFSSNFEFHHSQRGSFKIPPLRRQRSTGGGGGKIVL